MTDKNNLNEFRELVGDSFNGINSSQKFYINNNNELVICFDIHEIAAGAQGTPEFIIPFL